MAFVDQPRQQYGFDIHKHESCAKTLSYRYTLNQVDVIFWNNGRSSSSSPGQILK
ncbi:MAG: hypothetical protein WCF03_11450 [Nitrososphaeraceae archaeon]